MNAPSNPWLSAIAQMQLEVDHEQYQQRFNPRPLGSIVSGSATDLVLKALKEAPGFLTHAQIVWRTQRNTRVVSWALAYLLRLGRIEATTDARNSRYRRYRFKREARHGD